MLAPPGILSYSPAAGGRVEWGREQASIRNKGCLYVDHVTEKDEGTRLLTFYASRYPHSDEAGWREHIRAGRVLRNGDPASPDEKLVRGDRLRYYRPPWDEPDAPLDFGILYEDGDLVALDKPSGLPVLPGGNFLENTLLHLAHRRFGPSCSPLHRLGRGTSGVILFAKNLKTARFLTKAMVERRIRKVYLAKASGADMPDEFKVEARIGPVPYGRSGTVNAYSPNGREAISLVRVVRRIPDEDAAILEVTIPTGRPHQIRIHLAYAGYPLVGDPLYIKGGVPRPVPEADDSPRPGDCGYLLHSWKIRFPHPDGSGEKEIVSSPPPSLLAE